jgi:putative endonuclease
MPYYVYIIQCEGNSLYTGYTKNLNSRIRLHKKGKAARYTKMHPPEKLVHVEEFKSISEAMRREKRIKKLTHNQKLKLARSNRRRYIKKLLKVNL